MPRIEHSFAPLLVKVSVAWRRSPTPTKPKSCAAGDKTAVQAVSITAFASSATSIGIMSGLSVVIRRTSWSIAGWVAFTWIVIFADAFGAIGSDGWATIVNGPALPVIWALTAET